MNELEVTTIELGCADAATQQIPRHVLAADPTSSQARTASGQRIIIIATRDLVGCPLSVTLARKKVAESGWWRPQWPVRDSMFLPNALRPAIATLWR
jgi:hypothetical protein